MNDHRLSAEESQAIIKCHFENYDSNRDNPEKEAEHLFSCLFSAELDKFLGRLDLSIYGVNQEQENVLLQNS